MVAPDVQIEDGKGTILISSEEGETEGIIYCIYSLHHLGRDCLNEGAHISLSTAIYVTQCHSFKGRYLVIELLSRDDIALVGSLHSSRFWNFVLSVCLRDCFSITQCTDTIYSDLHALVHSKELPYLFHGSWELNE